MGDLKIYADKSAAIRQQDQKKGDTGQTNWDPPGRHQVGSAERRSRSSDGDSGDDSNSAAAACSPSPSKQPPRGARALTVSGTPACAPLLFLSMRRATDLQRTVIVEDQLLFKIQQGREIALK